MENALSIGAVVNEAIVWRNQRRGLREHEDEVTVLDKVHFAVTSL